MIDYTDVHTILVLGDSLAKGVILDEHKHRYRFTDSRYLKLIRDTISPDIIDASKFGATTTHGLNQLEKQLRETHPDLVFIEYGSNDSDFNWPEVAANPEGEHLPRLSLTEYVTNLKSLIARVREINAIPVMTNLHPLIPQRYFNWFTHGDPSAQEATLHWMRSTEYIYWWQEMYSDAAQRTGRSLDVPVLDIRRAFLTHPNYEELYCSDGIHPNESGHKVIYKAIMDRIRGASSKSWLD